ncbi:hypothetical protein LCGC14_2399840, partial [marine sediment metagenome]
DRINFFFHYINNFNLREVVLKLHDYRNTLNPQEIFFLKYFSTSFGIGQILKYWDRITKPAQTPLNQESLEYIISMIQEIYLDYHHKYFTKFDAVRLIKIYSNNTEGFKYTENYKIKWKKKTTGLSNISIIDWVKVLGIEPKDHKRADLADFPHPDDRLPLL